MAFRPTAKTIGTVAVTAAVTSAFWIVAYNTGRKPDAPEQAPVALAAVAAPDDPATKDAVVAPAVRGRRLEVLPSGLAIPVAGVRARDLLDTFRQARAGGARVHDAIDIIAPRGTPVVAAAPGVVEKLFFSQGGGGVTAYVRSLDGRWNYYYAHLDRYAPGLREGQRVGRGTPLGTVGVSGNANPNGPHLHFAINRMADGERWHEGRPVNPFPLLTSRR